jgi:hypothetical protein
VTWQQDQAACIQEERLVLQKRLDRFEDKTAHLSACFTPELSILGTSVGPASQGSKADIVCTAETALHKKIGLLVCKLKDTAYCPLEMLGQAFVSSANLLILPSDSFNLDSNRQKLQRH